MLDQTVSYSIYPSDNEAWPSSYYRQAPRIDLAKFYQDILKKSTQEQDQIQPKNSTKKSNKKLKSKKNKKRARKVTFSTEPPQIYEYEPEYDHVDAPSDAAVGFMSEGWPGRAKDAMNTSSFIDFKSKIEAKLCAANDASLVTELNNSMKEQESRGFYRHRKSPLVQKLNLRPIPNENFDVPSLVMDTTPSPSSSYCDSPGTPMDGYSLPILENFSQYVSISSSSTSSSSTCSSNGTLKSPARVAWLKTFSLLRSPTRTK
ncbi:hypothetical protein K501DRAFT_295147 [Backusella circina FSU 941]|nr:hypothetical protein K501DRAFT_295147 [Backusella circina FSU 941]